MKWIEMGTIVVNITAKHLHITSDMCLNEMMCAPRVYFARPAGWWWQRWRREPIIILLFERTVRLHHQLADVIYYVSAGRSSRVDSEIFGSFFPSTDALFLFSSFELYIHIYWTMSNGKRRTGIKCQFLLEQLKRQSFKTKKTKSKNEKEPEHVLLWFLSIFFFVQPTDVLANASVRERACWQLVKRFPISWRDAGSAFSRFLLALTISFILAYVCCYLLMQQQQQQQQKACLVCATVVSIMTVSFWGWEEDFCGLLMSFHRNPSQMSASDGTNNEHSLLVHSVASSNS